MSAGKIYEISENVAKNIKNFENIKLNLNVVITVINIRFKAAFIRSVEPVSYTHLRAPRDRG